ncbi:MAG: bifunctional glycosyltransferase family 2/GtrA family protein [Candidatus Nanopelagicales bacterium]
MASTHQQTRTHLAVLPAPSVPLEDRMSVAPAVDVVIPVYNEQLDLERSVRRLHAHLLSALPYSFRITIADNASTDTTWEIASRLSRQMPEVSVVHLAAKGRGRALRQVWSTSDAAVLAYMDVDLSTDLAALLPLLAPLLSGHSDVAIGTRLGRGSHVVRGPKREFISRTYNLILRATLGTGFTDAQCGFKAIRADAAAQLLPLVEDPEWFFDTELLVLAERSGMRIHEVPVDWVDDPGTTVDIVDTARKDLAGIWRLTRGLGSGRIPLTSLRTPTDAEQASSAPAGILGQLGRFALIGVLSTIAYAGLYWVLRAALPAQTANALALLATAIGNTAANRWFTFGVRGRPDRLRHQAQGLVVFGLGLAVTSGSLLLLDAMAPQTARTTELVVLTAANVLATVIRFLLYRAWVFGGRRDPVTRPLTTPTTEASR